MCLIGIAWRQHPRYPLIVAANRDEFYARATRTAHWWSGHQLLAGRDLEGGGTWLGVTRDGRFAALTNFREPMRRDSAGGKPSRGVLVREALATADRQAGAALAAYRDDFAGFNLITGRVSGRDAALRFATNRGTDQTALAPGIYGMSNGKLDAPWPKVRALRTTLAELDKDPSELTRILFDALAQPHIASDDALPDTGVGLELERRLSASFIHSDGYGTRCSTLLLVRADGLATFIERPFDEHGAAAADKTFYWRLSSTRLAQ